MKTYVQPAEIVTFTAPAGGVVSGTVYKIGGYIGVATVDAAAGVKFSFYIGPGAVTGPKATGAWTEGVKIYWDDTAKNFTTTVGTNVVAGGAIAAAASGDTTGVVKLDGIIH